MKLSLDLLIRSSALVGAILTASAVNAQSPPQVFTFKSLSPFRVTYGPIEPSPLQTVSGSVVFSAEPFNGGQFGTVYASSVLIDGIKTTETTTQVSYHVAGRDAYLHFDVAVYNFNSLGDKLSLGIDGPTARVPITNFVVGTSYSHDLWGARGSSVTRPIESMESMSAVPEPASCGLMLAGLTAIAWLRVGVRGRGRKHQGRMQR